VRSSRADDESGGRFSRVQASFGPGSSRRDVARAYGMIGVYGHADPAQSQLRLGPPERKHRMGSANAEMFVTSDALFDEIEQAVGA